MIGMISAMALAAAPGPAHHYRLDTIRVVSWTASDVVCGAESVKPVRMEVPAAVIARGSDPVEAAEPVYRFRIDAYGRALSIRADDASVFFMRAVPGTVYDAGSSRDSIRNSPALTAV